MLTRLAALLVLVLALVPAHAEACSAAIEANRLVGWSADGAYALLEAIDAKGELDHAEILPTTYAGFVYVIVADVDTSGMAVTRVKVGRCAQFSYGLDDRVIERSRKRLTDANVRTLKTVVSMRFGRDEKPSSGPLPTASFTGKKRWDVHDLALSSGITMPVPVWCVGECMIDEGYARWKATVDAVHTLPSGLVLYEVSLVNVCSLGAVPRLIAPTSPSIKVPKQRCTGSE